MRVEIWSDIVCPWCYIGKRRFEAAWARFPEADQVAVTWRSFELDRNAPRRREGTLADHLARKYGLTADQAQASQRRLTSLAADEGLTYRFDLAKPGNTLDAHRLLHLAAERGVQDATKERLLAAYLTEGAPIGERDTLVRVAADSGLDADEAREVLAGDAYLAAVRADEDDGTRLGITGVPFFVIDRTYGVAGAQSSTALLEVLQRAWDGSRPPVADAEAGDATHRAVSRPVR